MGRRIRHFNPKHIKGCELALDANFVNGEYLAPVNSPLDLNGCKLWLNADSIEGSDGDLISTWNDLSGEGNDATQSNDDYKPILKKDILNGKSVLRFDGSNDNLQLGELTTATGFSVFAVTIPASVTGGSSNYDGLPIVVAYKGNFINDFSLGFREGRVSTYSEYEGGNREAVSALTSVGVPVLAFGCSSLIETYSALNGIIGSILLGSRDDLIVSGIGRDTSPSSVGGPFFSGDIAEIIIYDKSLSTKERKRVEKYLNQKYNLWQEKPSDGDLISVWKDLSGNGNDATQNTVAYQPTLVKPVLPVNRPIDITGCKLWLNADSIEGNDGDSIGTWNDESGQGNNATQSLEDNKPILKRNILNGHSIVRFDGTNDYLSHTYFSLSSATYFIIYKKASIGNSVLLVVNGSYYSFLHYGSSWIYSHVYGSNRSVDLGSYGTSWCNLTAKIDSNEASVYINGNKKGSTNGSTDIPFQSIGFDSYGSANSDIAEIIVYDRALSDYERKRVENYLNRKYNLWTPQKNSVVRFNSSWLTIPGLSSLNAASLLISYRTAVAGDGSSIWNLATGSDDSKSYVPYYGTTWFDAFFTTIRKSGSWPDTGIQNIHNMIYSVCSGPNIWKNFLDGVLLYYTTSNVVAPPNTTEGYGSKLGAAQGIWVGGDVSTFMIIGEVLSRALLRRLEHTLAFKNRIKCS